MAQATAIWSKLKSPAFAGVGRFCREKPVGALGGAVFLGFILLAILVPFIETTDPIETNLMQRLLGPSSRYPLGTDDLGRDVLSRTLFGARLSMYVAVTATVLGNTVGALLGLFSGYLGGKLDLIMQRVMDMLLALPGLILAMALLIALGPGTGSVILAIAVTFIPRTNRLVRSAALSIKETGYVRAARALGSSTWRIVFQHVAPGCVAPFLVQSSALLGLAILFESSLSFLGLGVPPPTPSWGRTISEAMPFLEKSPWISLFPGIALSLTVLSINLFGDALRDYLDPRLKTL